MVNCRALGYYTIGLYKEQVQTTGYGYLFSSFENLEMIIHRHIKFGLTVPNNIGYAIHGASANLGKEMMGW